MNDAGRIGFVIRDDYDNNVQYDFLDVVYYHGNSYVAKKLTFGNIPNENNEYWHILAAGGVRVKGDAETEYRDGDVNITKADIGLRETENKSSETIRSEITSENVTDALGYTPIKGIKGNAETTYRTGDVNLTPENLGIDIMQGSTTTTPGKAGLVPAPGTGNPDAVLKSNGTWAEGTYRSLGEVSASGWYRIFSKTTSAVAGSGDAFMLTVSRGYSNNPPENFRVVCSTKYNSVQWCWHTLSSMVTSSKFVDKVRAAKKGNLLYIEVHYTASVRNTISFEMLYNSGFGTFSQEPRQALNFEPAEANETVVSEYTIPDKDDFETSKSLTRFEEIPEGADLNSEKYAVPGNYMCSSNDAAQTLKNCPFNLAFTMTVKYGNGFPDYCIQTFETYRANGIAKRFRNSKKEWETPLYYYPSLGTPPANKLWGTDANGNVGWIDPPR